MLLLSACLQRKEPLLLLLLLAGAPHAYTPSELLSKCHLLNVIKERGRDFGSTAQKRFGVLQTIGGFFAQMLSPTSVNGLIFVVFDAGLLVSRLR